MKKILIILPVLALGILTFSAVSLLSSTNAFAAAAEEVLRETIDLDNLSAAERKEIEEIAGKKIEDFSAEERAKAESLTFEEMRAEKAVFDEERRKAEAVLDDSDRELTDEEKRKQREYERKAAELTKGLTAPTAVSEDLFKELDVEELAFAKGKEGCAMKSSFFYAVSRQYEKGASLEDLTSFKVIAPLFEQVIADIKLKGVEQANIDNIKEYEACVARYAGETGARSEKHDACVALNAVVTDTVNSIERRQSVDTVLSRHERKDIDLSETAYKNMTDPIPLFVGRLYQVARADGIKSAKALASSITIGCAN